MKNFQIKKIYYSISEVSKIVDEESYVLRYWETEFDVLNPQKNRAGNRTYKEKDITIIKAIKALLRGKRYTVDGAKSILATFNPDTKTFEGIDEPIDIESPNTVTQETTPTTTKTTIKNTVSASIQAEKTTLPSNSHSDSPAQQPTPQTPTKNVVTKNDLLEMKSLLMKMLRTLQNS